MRFISTLLCYTSMTWSLHESATSKSEFLASFVPGHECPFIMLMTKKIVNLKERNLIQESFWAMDGWNKYTCVTLHARSCIPAAWITPTTPLTYTQQIHFLNYCQSSVRNVSKLLPPFKNTLTPSNDTNASTGYPSSGMPADYGFYDRVDSTIWFWLWGCGHGGDEN